MRCHGCSSELPPGFPGATIRCACGAHTTLAPARAPALRADGEPGPYRARGVRGEPSAEARCPFCGGACPPLASVCPSCDVPLDRTRCPGCFTVRPFGGAACERCGRAADPAEPGRMAEVCPRCATPLETARHPETDARIQECPQCGGLFVPRDALADIVRRAEETGAFVPESQRGRPAPDTVAYLPCPQCRTMMHRQNFGAASGIIVDACRPHGTWFDAGELSRAVEFTSAGGLAAARARRATAAAERREAPAAAPIVPPAPNIWNALVRDLILGKGPRW